MKKSVKKDIWSKEILPASYLKLLENIKAHAYKAQSRAVEKVNHELVMFYWSVGKAIHQKLHLEKWGKCDHRNSFKRFTKRIQRFTWFFKI